MLKKGAKRLLGPKYSIIDKIEKRKKGKKFTIVFNFGGSANQNFTFKIVTKLINKSNKNFNYNIIAGPLSKNLHLVENLKLKNNQELNLI